MPTKIDAILSRMTIDEKLGQMILASIEVSQMNDATREFLCANHIGNVILFGKNCAGRENLARLNTEIQAAIQAATRLLEAGDLPSACRRLMVCACEDVGLAYPQIIPIVKAAIDAANMVGLPEARLPLADAVILVATSPKSNSAHDAINAAIADVQAGRTGPIPRQLQNKHYDGEDALVKGQNYKYAHDYAHHWVEQQYLPDAIKDVKYYTFGDNKNEQAARAYWAKIKGEENV